MRKFDNIVNSIESKIKSRILRVGEKLPSIRALALEFDVSHSTVIRALSDLETRNLIYAVEKSGYYVLKNTFIEESGNEWIDFATSAPDSSVFPYLDFKHCINEAIDIYKQDLFLYGTTKGLPSLISVIQKELTNYQVFALTSSIFIVSGVQQALTILASLPFPNGKEKILVEQPGYFLFLEHLTHEKIPVLGIRRTMKGIDLEELERIFQTESIKFFYTMPRLHNPLGTSYSEIEKQQIAKLAAKYDVYLVEDDHLSDLLNDPKSDPLYSYSDKNRTIYLKSYSKIIFPGLRIGVAVVPEVLAIHFTRVKRSMDIDSSMLSQAALEIYLNSGMFGHHKIKMRTIYNKRATLMQKLLEEGAQDPMCGFLAPPSPGNTALLTHIVLNENSNAKNIIARAAKKKLAIEAVDKHYLPNWNRDPLLKLSIANVKETQITEGMRLLTTILKNNKYD